MSNVVELITNSEKQTTRLAAALSNYAGAGEFFGLTGELGCGKSVFARAFLRTLADDPHLEVPSPTFTLVQTYEELRIKAGHFDLYRVTDSSEMNELGLEDALIDALVLVEWPERTPYRHFADRLMIVIEDISPQQRKITLTGHGVWRDKLKRWHLSAGFLQQAGWGEASRAFLQGDASHRRYERIADKTRRAVLMDMPHISAGETYSTVAHLAQGVAPFIAMTTALRSHGFSAPEIFANRPEDGFLLLEDLGACVYFHMAARGEDITVPMQAAVDVLVHLAQKPERNDIPAYDAAALQIEIELLPDWYWPHMKDAAIAPGDRAEFLELWQPLLQHLEEGPQIWCLRDYHSPNLIWLPERHGIARVGLLDYQDAVWGSPAYDLMSLLQDARRDVPADVETRLYDYYWQQLEQSDIEYDRCDFDLTYAILGAQRAVKILGIFARLAARDNKPGYLAHIPRVRAYLQRNLHHPRLNHLKQWFDHHLPIHPQMTKSSPAAMVMAAGLGTRMHPLTATRPKPLVELNGTALIDYTLHRLAARNISPIVVNVHYLPDMLEHHLAHSTIAEVIIADERVELLDTGGGALANLDILGPEPFLVLNSDSLWIDDGEDNLSALMDLWDDDKMDCLMLLAPRHDSVGYSGDGDFDIGADGKLQRRAHGKKVPYVYTGCCLIHPRAFISAPKGAFSLNLLWDQVHEKQRLYGVALNGLWLHIGTPEALRAAEEKLKQSDHKLMV